MAHPRAENVRIACQDSRTILGRRDFVVIVRRWRHHGAFRRPGVWLPVGVAESRELAEAMAELLRAEPNTEVRAVSAAELMHKIRGEDRERIVESLNSRTTAEIERERTLRQAAALRLSGTRDRRSGGDRRSGRDRRSTRERLERLDLLPRDDRRSGRDRRSSSDRRRLRASA